MFIAFFYHCFDSFAILVEKKLQSNYDLRDFLFSLCVTKMERFWKLESYDRKKGIVSFYKNVGDKNVSIFFIFSHFDLGLSDCQY